VSLGARLLGFFHDKRFYALEFRLKPAGKIVRSIFKEDNEAKREKYEQNEPKEPANKRHAGIVIDS
jgi:hypothetical protein